MSAGRGRRDPGWVHLPRGAPVAALILSAVLATGCSAAGGTGSGVPDPPSGSPRTSLSPSTSPSTSPRTSPSPTEPADEEPTTRPAYVASVERIDAALRARMRSSHRPGCPVSLRDLRYLRVGYVDPDGVARTGELVVHRDHAQGMVRVFRELYAAGWPIRRMRLVDEYGGDDDASMAADNTSAYNCRAVSGGSGWSEHAYGRAIDLNPVENPYVQGSSVAPPAGRRFAAVDRSAGAPTAPGVIREGDVVTRAFAAIGWEWGGLWVGSKDYQHFSATGR